MAHRIANVYAKIAIPAMACGAISGGSFATISYIKKPQDRTFAKHMDMTISPVAGGIILGMCWPVPILSAVGYYATKYYREFRK